MYNNQIQLYGVTQEDIQNIFECVIREYKNRLPRWVYVDASYLYNFHLDDFEIVRRFCQLGRYDIKAVFEWQRYLERWLCDQTVTLEDKEIKPIKIVRSLDRVVNEGMETAAVAFLGGDIVPFVFHALGSGVISEVKPSDKIMVNQISRINVLEDPNGGSISRDGSTLYIIGNHSKSIDQADLTESGVFNSENETSDLMLDHSLFENPIEHLINQDVPGSTTVIWQCSV